MKKRNREKKAGWLTAAAFLGCLCAFTALSVFLPKKVFSHTENRYLAEKPKFSWEAFIDGRFAEDYETYLSDQFPGRDGLVAVQAEAQRLAGKKDVNGVYFGKDGYYIERFDREEMMTEQLLKNLRCLAQAALNYKEKLGEEHVRVMLVPSASQIMTDMLPDHASPWNQEEVYGLLEKSAGELLEEERGKESPSWLLRPDQILKQHQKEDLYYRTDHHWTSRGAYYGFSYWMKSIGLEPLPAGSYVKTEATRDFLGTIQSKLNLPMEPDRIEIWTPKDSGTQKGQFQVYYDGLHKDYGSLYDLEKLKGKDKYAVFLGGNHGLTEIVNKKAENSRRLLIIKDSYAHCFAVFAAPYFEKVYLADLRYMNQRLSELAAENQVTDVLVLYQIPGFAKDENVTKIAR